MTAITAEELFFFSKASVVHVRAGSAVRRRARHKVAETTTTAEAMSTPIARGRIKRTFPLTVLK